MRTRWILPVFLATACGVPFFGGEKTKEDKTLHYPPTRIVDQVDDLHGKKVADPYRWLESMDSPETRAWVDAENKVTFAYLAGIPARGPIAKRLERLWDHERYGTPTKVGSRYVYSANDGLQDQSVLYVAESLAAEPRVLLDPNKLSEDGAVALAWRRFSRDGRFMAYGVSSGGSDWNEIRVIDVESGAELPDRIEWVKFGGAQWVPDGSGFFYNRFPKTETNRKLAAANYGQQVCYHELGTDQGVDIVVLEAPKSHPEERYRLRVSEDGLWVIQSKRRRSKDNGVLFRRFTDAKALLQGEWQTLFEPGIASFGFLGNDGPLFYLRTDKDAPKGRVISVDVTGEAERELVTLIPESPDTLRSVSVIADRFVCNYLKHAHSSLRIHALDGAYQNVIPLPALGTASGLCGRRGDQEGFFSFSSFTRPRVAFHYDFKLGRASVFREPVVDFDPERYVTRQVWYASKDGTRIPMFLVHRKGIAKTGDHPVLLHGYGGFNIAQTPRFSIANIVWLEMGGIYVLANLRGGGEYGEEWHKAGTKLEKQNVFDDFISAAEFLILEGWTSRKKLAIQGGSNGGLLVGACMTQRPDLFGACLPAVGVMDMLRFHKFTIGHAWIGDYGSPDDAEQFKALYDYSPLHQLEPDTLYPATLVTTADHDDRVVPAHSFKFIARLQACQAGPAPVLIRVETRAGHGAGTPTSKRIAQIADKWAFLVDNLGMNLPADF